MYNINRKKINIDKLNKIINIIKYNNLKNKIIYHNSIIKKKLENETKINLKSQQIEMNKNNNHPKFICVGQPKTGTKTLKDIFTQFGFKPCMDPIILNDEVILDNNIKINKTNFFNNVDYLLDNLHTFDFFHDIPYSYNYEQIDKLFPNAKFILTIREENDWFNSLINYQKIENAVSPSVLKILFNYEFITENLKDEIIIKFKTYNQNVIDYFSNRKDKLIIINICDKDKNKEQMILNLSKIINVDIPSDFNFPHINIQNYT